MTSISIHEGGQPRLPESRPGWSGHHGEAGGAPSIDEGTQSGEAQSAGDMAHHERWIIGDRDRDAQSALADLVSDIRTSIDFYATSEGRRPAGPTSWGRWSHGPPCRSWPRYCGSGAVRTPHVDEARQVLVA